MLWMYFSKQSIEGYQVIKIPRNHETNVLKGYAFCGFESRELAIKAKAKLNYTEVFGNTIRIALIT